MKKRPIDRKRDSGGQANIGAEEDGAIVGTSKIGERLLIIKERSIYELQLADDIDPERTNIGLPINIQTLVIDKGSESEMVSRSFLTANNLFKSEFLIEDIDSAKAMSVSLEILKELDALDKEITEFLVKEKEVTGNYEQNTGKPISYAVPSIGNVETRCKTIFQKVDHIEQMLIELITLFYSEDGLKKQSHFPNFRDILVEKYGVEEPFTKFINEVSGFMSLTRSLRNALDHRLEFVKVSDFELQPNSDIISPTIELKKYRQTKLDRIPLSEFLPIVRENLIFTIENTMAYLSGKNARTNIFPYSVREIPEDKRRNKHIRYSFGHLWVKVDFIINKNQMPIAKTIENKIYKFFIDSNDFNGMPLRQVSEELKIDYEQSIDIIKTLVSEDKITIQSSTNPHIIYSSLYPIDIQLKILENAKSWEVIQLRRLVKYRLFQRIQSSPFVYIQQKTF